MALICASKGTLGEKATALFNLYSYMDMRARDSFHQVPVTRLAKSITETQAESIGECAEQAARAA